MKSHTHTHTQSVADNTRYWTSMVRCFSPIFITFQITQDFTHCVYYIKSAGHYYLTTIVTFCQSPLYSLTESGKCELLIWTSHLKLRLGSHIQIWQMLLIQNATNDWTKSWLFLPALYRKSAKLFVRKLCQKRAHL